MTHAIDDTIAAAAPPLWDGFTISEAGAVLGLSEPTARSRYQRAKQQLRDALDEESVPYTRP